MYLLKNKKVLHDFDLILLKEIVEFVDEKINVLSSESIQEPLEDWGIFDRIENITGLGFVACQTYMASTYGFANVSKNKALLFGPKLSHKLTSAELINHAANFWKHCEEWQITGNIGPRKSLVQGFFEISYNVNSEFPLSGCLAELTNGNAHFESVVKILEK
jgi:hypothetical protein